MNDLPPELLELIFLDCHNASPQHATRTDAPLNLSATCTRWRDIASGIPSLWSSLHVTVNHTTSSPPIEVVQNWLDLSHSCPLQLSLVCKRRTGTVTGDNTVVAPSDRGVSRVLELFLLNMYRWRTASFDYSQHAPPIDYPESLTAQGAPQLEHLEVHPYSWSALLGALPIPWLEAAVSSAPLLHSFTSHFGKFPRGFFARVPWGQLTILRLETRLSEVACLYILQSALLLVECHLLNIRPESVEGVPPFDPSLATTVPHLRVLSVASQVGFDRLFRPLVAPELQILEIATRSTQMRWDHAQFMAFLQRSSCSLLSLTLRDLFISRLGAPELHELLAFVSHSLTALAITSEFPGTPVRVEDALLQALSYRPKGPVLCPQLERLVLQLGASAIDGVLADMVESRWEGHRAAPARIGRLVSVDVVCTTGTHATDVERLNELFGRGLGGRVRMPGGVDR
ncbi:hypothetical protein FB45DRAFT_832562 [Roridomyces roridus]|uniref:F-box domain-containing protein n=1 Tax=Roridomyces roridus TaxID=1738132 RepID=A0AAD7FQD8_9AGAR|nr:hypothetical protein FB45DRAFT_832562 [Roridomyces roridus]